MQLDAVNAEPSLEDDLFQTIIQSKNVFYKSQQIDDPDLLEEEKLAILKELFNRSKTGFLSRYGKYLMQRHLQLFDTEATRTDYEVQHHLNEIKFRIAHHDSLVKNRRFMALERMIEDTDYFSEVEMMRREPVLYEQLIGQYLSEEEKRDRDYGDCSERTLVDMIYKGIDDDASAARHKDAAIQSETRPEASRSSFEESEDEDQVDVPMRHSDSDDATPIQRTHWGDFDEPALEFPSSSKDFNKPSKPETFIMAPEKEMLRDEFKSIMYANFLSGQDKEFDYSEVDENSQFDDENIRSRDIEDKYFDSEETTETNKMQQDGESSEEDTLDMYMRALEKQIHRRDVQDISNQLEFLDSK